MVSQTLPIMGATMSPTLSILLPSVSQIDAIIAGVVNGMQKYAHIASSLKSSAEIIRDADRRRKFVIDRPICASELRTSDGGWLKDLLLKDIMIFVYLSENTV